MSNMCSHTHKIYSDIPQYAAILHNIPQYVDILRHILLDVHTTEICRNIAAYCSKRMCNTFFEKYTVISQHIFYRMNIGTKRTCSHWQEYWVISRHIQWYRRISRYIRRYRGICRYITTYSCSEDVLFLAHHVLVQSACSRPALITASVRIAEYTAILQNMPRYYRILQNITEYYRIYRDITVYSVILQNMPRYFIAPRSHTR